MTPFLRYYMRTRLGAKGTQRKHPLLRKKMNPAVPHLRDVKAKSTPDPLRTAISNKLKGTKYPTNSLGGVIRKALRISKPRARRLNKQKIY